MIAPADLLQLEWRNPWWLLLALQPLLLAGLLRLRRHRLLHYADAHLLPWAVSGQRQRAESGWRRAANLLFWLMLAGALAGPRLPLPGDQGGQAPSVPRHDMDIAIVLDVSPSMRAQDGDLAAGTDRLSRAKLKLLDLKQRLRGERIGLLAFSGEAGVLMPFARDTGLLDHYLQLAQPTLFDDAGTGLAAALRLALAQHDGKRSLAVLLVSDGEVSALSGDAGNAALAAARALRAAQVPLYVLALGSEQGATIPLPDGGVAEESGTPVISRLDKAGFSALAATTGGRLATLTNDDNDLAALYDRGMLTLRAQSTHKDSTRNWQELYPWLLAPALLLFLLSALNQRQLALAALAVAASSAHAAPDASEWNAYQSYRQHDYLLAQQQYALQGGYSARMGEGASAFRRRDYGYAVKQFTEALLLARTLDQRADALFNLGNSYYYAGNLIAALDALQGVLRYRNDEKARANLARVTAQIKPGAAPFSNGPARNRGRALGEGEVAGGDAPVEMENVKDKESPRVLQQEDTANAEQARGARSKLSASAFGQADVRAAQKKMELLRDQPAQLAKRLMTQDRSQDSAGDLRPW